MPHPSGFHYTACSHSLSLHAAVTQRCGVSPWVSPDMADSLYIPDPTAQDTLVQPWDEAFRVRMFRYFSLGLNAHNVWLRHRL
jgi:hypothetical protein